ncbi:MAG: peroxidase-related enzyme, partial [Planctomycetes bacterium]|nr:peroxidase-related enzyme [Planctomycetota bacterium]
VDNILKIHSLHPRGLETHLELYKAVMQGTSTLPTVDREMIALTVSVLNRCHYLVVHHRGRLRQLHADETLIAHLEEDFERADLDPRRLAMLRYVATLTKKPWGIVDKDIDDLRAAGFGEQEILVIAEITSYFAFVNRIAAGLGVEIEPWVPRH